MNAKSEDSKPNNIVAPEPTPEEIAKNAAKAAELEDAKAQGTPVTPADPQSGDQATSQTVAPEQPENDDTQEVAPDAAPVGESKSFFGKDYEKTPEGGYRKVPEAADKAWDGQADESE